MAVLLGAVSCGLAPTAEHEESDAGESAAGPPHDQAPTPADAERSVDARPPTSSEEAAQPGASGAASRSGPASPTVPRPGAPASFADLVERVKPAVVNISSRRAIPGLARIPAHPYYGAPTPQQASSLGSGFIVDDAGHIVTNSHVIDQAEAIEVSTHDGETYAAEIVGVDPMTDLALIRIEPFEGMQHLSFGDSDATRVGDWLVAVGNPFGLNSTVTAGILSGRGRTRRDIGLGGDLAYVDFLQTDASINPGNSGGPLINMRGEVIGINTAMRSGGENVAFAIPSNMARVIVPQLADRGYVERSWLGVRIADVSVQVAAGAGLAEPRGAYVAAVAQNGPAAVAGVQPGDVILSFDGTPLRDSDDLPWLASNAGVGEEVDLEVARNGSVNLVSVRLGMLPGASAPTPPR